MKIPFEWHVYEFVKIKLFFIYKFLIRQEVLKTYKQLLKSINRVDDKSYRYYLIDWLRNDFKANKNIKDEVYFLNYFNQIYN